MIVLDANVLIAFADSGHMHHEAAKSILLEHQHLAVSAVTGAEVMIHPLRGGDWLDAFADLGLKVVAVADKDMAGVAATRRATALKLPDAIVLHTAQTLGASLATFDRVLAARAQDRGVPVWPDRR